jgi:hypothetical protein
VVRHHAVFASLQLTLCFLGLAWAGVILGNLLDRQGTIEGFGFLGLQEHGTTLVYAWVIGNALYAFFAFVAALLIGNRHPDGWAVGVFTWLILVLGNALPVWHSFRGPWYIVVPVVGVLLIGQTALLFYRRRPNAGTSG